VVVVVVEDTKMEQMMEEVHQGLKKQEGQELRIQKLVEEVHIHIQTVVQDNHFVVQDNLPDLEDNLDTVLEVPVEQEVLQDKM